MTMPEVPGASWPIQLHHRLRIAREEAGLSQAELAEAIDVGRRSVTHYENGEIRPKRHVIVAWALRTGASSEWLVTGENAPAGGEVTVPKATGVLPGSDLGIGLGESLELARTA